MKPRILIVDDEVDVVTLLQYVLGEAGCEVATATSGVEALRQARLVRPDAVLLDIQLPDRDGFSVCEQLRAQPETARLPVILFSNHGGAAVRARGAEAGCWQCLRKSESIETIVRSVWQAATQAGPARAARNSAVG
jgi:CheY-like chemotaxis protein